MVDIAKRGQSRVFTIEDRAGPSRVPVYQTLAAAGASSWSAGDITPIRTPDPNRYDNWIIVDEVTGAEGLPELPLTIRMKRELSEFLRIRRKGCPIDLQVHWGSCKNPAAFNEGFDKVTILEGARITNYTTDEQGALDSGDQAAVNETVTLQGRDLYEVKPISGSEVAASQIVQEVLAVAICDTRSCGGACGAASDGIQRWFAIQSATGGSPGLAAELIYTKNNGATIGETNITSLPANQNPSGMACVGTRLVVISNTDLSLHHALTDDIVRGVGSWSRVATGFVTAKGPNEIFSLGQAFNWIVGDGGYIYFSADVASGVTVQDAGVTTAQVLNDIHGIDELNLVAVGAANAVVVTTNGGTTWTSVTGPAVGVVLNTVWMKSKQEWLIGTAGGRLYYTADAGVTWTEKTFSGSGAGVVRDIVFATPSVGYMSHDTATPRGRIFRTIDGGSSWYALPEATGLSLPLADRFNALAASGDNPNFVVAGGLGDNATDGILVKVA